MAWEAMMKWVLSGIFVLLFICGCSFSQNSNGRSIASVATSELQKDDLRLQRNAEKFNGQFQGSKIAGKRQLYDVADCHFVYDRGLEMTEDGAGQFQYERFILNFMGSNQKSNEKAFDSVVYNQRVYGQKLIQWNFSQSFGPVALHSGQAQDGLDSQKAMMTFERMDGTKAKMIFTHSDSYSVQNSAFYLPGEKRDYKVVLEFDEFTDIRTKLSHASVEATSSTGGKVVDVQCSQFFDPEEK